MSTPTTFAAQILETSAAAYAGYAASLLLERQPEVAARYAPAAMRMWQANLQQRVMELAAALAAEEPKLFLSRIRWEDRAFRARDMDPGDLRSALDCLREVLREELPETARDGAVGVLDTALALFDQTPADEPGLDPADPLERRALRYLETALRGDARGAVERIAGAVRDGLAAHEGYEVLLAAQREIGRMWHVGEIEIVEEHVVTATTQRAISVLAQNAPRAPENGKTVVVGGVAGNGHDLSVRVLADFFELDGWRAVCLGGDVPTPNLAAAVVYFDADLLAVSAALAAQLKTLRRAVEAVRALPEREVKILVGGLAFADAPELWRRLGADGSAADAADAVALGGRLVGLAS